MSDNQDIAPPAYKRRRVALACTSCRSRKSRCNGQKPSCGLCLELGFDCVYEQPALSGQSKSYKPDHNERLLAVEQTLQALLRQQDSSSNEAIRHRYRYSASSTIDESTELLTAADNSIVNDDVATFDETWPQHQNVDEDEVDGLATIANTERGSSSFYGPSSNIAFLRQTSDFALAVLKRAVQFQPSEEATVRSISSPPKPRSAALSTSAARNGALDLHALPPKNRALELIRTFFSGPGIPFVFVHEEGMIENYETARAKHFVGVERPWLCLLNAIFAIATEPGIVMNEPRQWNGFDSEIFFERALALSKEVDARSVNVNYVQSLLLMCAYCQGTLRLEQTWTLHGLAVRAALQLGLHSQTASQGLSALDSEIRKRTWCGCVLLDRTLSMTFGRPQTIPKQYINLALPLNCRLEDLIASRTGSLQIGATNTVCFFNATLQLYLILGDIISQLYGANLDAERTPDAPEVLPIVVAFEEKLSSWKRSLPAELRKKPWDVSDAHMPHPSYDASIFDRLSVIVKLRYLNVRTLLHRKAVVTALLRVSSVPIAESRPDETFVNGFEESSCNICEESATEVVDIIYAGSRSASLLGASWFSSYYTFNAALVLFNCILLWSTAWVRRRTTDPAVYSDETTTSKVIVLFTSLSRADEALQRLEPGTTTGARIGKAMSKLLRICKTLARSHPSHSEALVRALGPISDTQVGNSVAQQHQKSGGLPNTAILTHTTPPLRTQRVFNPLDQMISPFLTDGDMDIFTDLGADMEFGLTDLLTG